jgi:thiamine-monophosphate kinase
MARLGGGATRIGRIVEGRGVRVLGLDGTEMPPSRTGWNHFVA